MKRLFAALLACPTVASAALIDRGGGLIYDDALNITWLQDANYARTSGYDFDGRMTWERANAWASSLVFAGYDDWRLPVVRPLGATFDYEFSNNGTTDDGYHNYSQASELAYMFYVNIGNLGLCVPNDLSPSACDYNSIYTGGSWYIDASFNSAVYANSIFKNINNNDDGLFPNIGWGYFFGTPYSPISGYSWFFNFHEGYQGAQPNYIEHYAWAVRDGDVLKIPEPSTLPLVLLAGLTWLATLRQRRI